MRKKLYAIMCCLLIMPLCVGCSATNKKAETASPKKQVVKATPNPTPASTSGPISRSVTFPDNNNKVMPEKYMRYAKKRGQVVEFNYKTKDYTESGEGKEYTKRALVYLPYGYNQKDKTKKYNVIYFMHGGGCNEKWFLYGPKQDSPVKGLMDHMIEDDMMDSCIMVTPTYQNKYCSDEGSCTKYFHNELTNDLIPAVESKYNTYYDSSKKDAAKESRLHRAFGGFSMGGATTWWVFSNCIKEIAYFMPMSGDSWCVSGSPEDKVKDLANSVKKQGFTAKDFLLFAGVGGPDDIAHNNVIAQMRAMKKDGSTFQNCKNFKNGNLYLGLYKDAGHDIHPVLNSMYNGLPTFFRGL